MNDRKKCDNDLETLQMDETPELAVKGREMGINDPVMIMNEVHGRGLPEERSGGELLEKVKRIDHVLPSMGKDRPGRPGPGMSGPLLLMCGTAFELTMRGI